MQIYAATSNLGKLRDFAQSAASEGIEILAVPGLAAMPEPVEDAPDFAGNAALKAIAYSRLAPGLLVMADDSGLEVDALGGRPGVRSARFADDLNFEPASARSPAGGVSYASGMNGMTGMTGMTKDERNNLCLLSLLSPQPSTASLSARYVCALALARDGEVLHRASGAVRGEILKIPRGTKGFGYDPLFLLPSAGKTMAELDPETKWANSHRGCAFRALLATLRNSDLAQSRDFEHRER